MKLLLYALLLPRVKDYNQVTSSLVLFNNVCYGNNPFLIFLFFSFQQVTLESLAVIASQDILAISKVTNPNWVSFQGWTDPIPTMEELFNSSIFVSFIQHSTLLILFWVVSGLLSNIYSTRIPYKQTQIIFDGTNQQFLTVCNISIICILLYMFSTQNPFVDIYETFTEIFASYLAVLLSRIVYSSNPQNDFRE